MMDDYRLLEGPSCMTVEHNLQRENVLIQTTDEFRRVCRAQVDTEACIKHDLVNLYSLDELEVMASGPNYDEILGKIIDELTEITAGDLATSCEHDAMRQYRK